MCSTIYGTMKTRFDVDGPGWHEYRKTCDINSSCAGKIIGTLGRKRPYTDKGAGLYRYNVIAKREGKEPLPEPEVSPEVQQMFNYGHEFEDVLRDRLKQSVYYVDDRRFRKITTLVGMSIGVSHDFLMSPDGKKMIPMELKTKCGYRSSWPRSLEEIYEMEKIPRTRSRVDALKNALIQAVLQVIVFRTDTGIVLRYDGAGVFIKYRFEIYPHTPGVIFDWLERAITHPTEIIQEANTFKGIFEKCFSALQITIVNI